MRQDFGPYRLTPATVRRPELREFCPRYTLDGPVFDDLRRVERADQELRRFRADEATARRLLEDAMTRNAYGTASIEGNPLTLEDVQSLLARGPTPDAMRRPEEREILNYADFLRELPRRRLPATPDEVLDLHGTLFRGVLPDAGTFKERPNFIGRRDRMEVVFVPATPGRVRPELRRALAWLHSAKEHPLVRAQVFFHEFESIHPFRDGNGRIGRALTTLALHHFGYEGVRYALVDYEFNEDRDAYYGHLQAVDRLGLDFTPWVRYMSGVLARTFDGAVRRFLFREALPASLDERQVQVAGWFARLHRGSPRRRVKFADVHAAFPAVAERTLKRDLARLRDAGVLAMEGERKAARYRLATRFRDAKAGASR